MNQVEKVDAKPIVLNSMCKRRRRQERAIVPSIENEFDDLTIVVKHGVSMNLLLHDVVLPFDHHHDHENAPFQS